MLNLIVVADFAQMSKVDARQLKNVQLIIFFISIDCGIALKEVPLTPGSEA